MSHLAAPNDLPWWRRLLALEPAVVKGVVAALVLLAGVWGIDLADLGVQVEQTVTIIWGTLVPLLTSAWIRTSVTPSARVVEVVTPSGAVVAGPASPLRDGTPVRVQTTDVHILPLDPPA